MSHKELMKIKQFGHEERKNKYYSSLITIRRMNFCMIQNSLKDKETIMQEKEKLVKTLQTLKNDKKS